MTTLTYHPQHRSDHGSGLHALASFAPVAVIGNWLVRRWDEHKLLNTLDAMPLDAQKDIGFPGAERMHEH